MLKLRDARKDETTGHNLLQVDVNVIPSHGVVVCNSQARNWMSEWGKDLKLECEKVLLRTEDENDYLWDIILFNELL